MIKIRCSFLATSVAFALLNCTNVEKVDTTSVKEHLGDYKIKKISPEEIIAQAEKSGGDSKVIIEKQLNDEDLVKRSACDFGLFPVADSLNTLSPGSVKMVRIEELKGGIFHPKEKEVLEAYQYSFEKDEASGTNIQQLNDTLYLFTIPVSKKSAYSKSCLSKDPDAYGVVELLLNKSRLIRQIR